MEIMSTGKFIMAAGVAGMVLSLIILAVALKILKKSEKKIKESIWKEYR